MRGSALSAFSTRGASAEGIPRVTRDEVFRLWLVTGQSRERGGGGQAELPQSKHLAQPERQLGLCSFLHLQAWLSRSKRPDGEVYMAAQVAIDVSQAGHG